MKWLVRLLVARLGRTQETLKTRNYFTIDGLPIHCQLCHTVIQYPPIKIPLGPPRHPTIDPIFTEDGYCLNPETTYGRFHIACANRYLLELQAADLEYQLQEIVKDEQPDPG